MHASHDMGIFLRNVQTVITIFPGGYPWQVFFVSVCEGKSEVSHMVCLLLWGMLGKACSQHALHLRELPTQFSQCSGYALLSGFQVSFSGLKDSLFCHRTLNCRLGWPALMWGSEIQPFWLLLFYLKKVLWDLGPSLWKALIWFNPISCHASKYVRTLYHSVDKVLRKWNWEIQNIMKTEQEDTFI